MAVLLGVLFGVPAVVLLGCVAFTMLTEDAVSSAGCSLKEGQVW